MVFGGFQKLSLLDFPGCVSCTAFLSGCNFRCPFCHNASLALGTSPESYPEEELLAYLNKRKGILEGITVTGGEPLLYKALPDFLGRVKALGYKVKLDTNGSQPEALQALVEGGLVDYVAMDIKNSPALYGKTVGIVNLDLAPIAQSKDFLLEGRVDYEFRTTVVRGLHTRESLEQAAQWILGAKAYYLQCFVDSGNLLQPEGLGAFHEDEMTGLCKAVQIYIPNTALRGI